MTMPDMLAPTYAQMLGALDSWLDKAVAQMPESKTASLMTARLAPDMFPLSTQIRFACVQALEGVFRLRSLTFSAAVEILLNEGRNGSDQPGSIADAKVRIEETLSVVAAATSEECAIEPTTPIAHILPQGMIFDLTAEQYIRDWALPQFYFHVMTAYAILRAQGVQLGKADFVGHMFAYLRPGTAPGQ